MTMIRPFGLQVDLDILTISEDKLIDLKHLLKKHKLIVIKGKVQSKTSLIDFSKRWGEIVQWPFGEILELRYDPTAEDHIFDSSRMPMHWDGMYREHIPHLQIFHCIESEQAHGRTIFTDTKKIIEDLTVETKNKWQKVVGHYHRKALNYEGKTCQNLIEKHPLYDYEVLRYQELITEENFKNPATASFDNTYESFHSEILSMLYDSNNHYAHSWQKGDIVIADNFTLLHAREGYQKRTKRHIQRVQIHSEVPFKNLGLRLNHEAS